MNNRTEAKLTDLSGMRKAIEEILKQAWERGRKYGQNEERPQGEWKHNNFDEHYCNKCGNFALWSEEADGYYEVQSNFCPNCGADMRGVMKND